MTKGFSGLEKEISVLQDLYEIQRRQLQLKEEQLQQALGKLLLLTEAFRTVSSSPVPTHRSELSDLARREMELLLEDE